MINKLVTKYMSSLGKKGGKAKGVSKVRGDSEYYRKIRSMRKSKPSATHGKEGE